jgi:hypothetical protein
MMTTWRGKLIFWTATLASCICLVATAMIGRAIIRLINPSGPAPIEALVVAALVLQPLLILALIVRAIKLRGTTPVRRTMARAFYALASIPLMFAEIPYLMSQAEERQFQKMATGSITFVCSLQALYADPKMIGPGNLKLTAVRHPGTLSTWFVVWPGEPPIEAKSFEAATGSIGGSQGITWQGRDTKRMTAYLSFSDLLTAYGSETIWGKLAQVSAGEEFKPDSAADSSFTCAADPATYRP